LDENRDATIQYLCVSIIITLQFACFRCFATTYALVILPPVTIAVFIFELLIVEFLFELKNILEMMQLQITQNITVGKLNYKIAIIINDENCEARSIS